MTPMMSLPKSLIFTAIGLAGIIIGSNFVVENASGLAGAMGISDRIIAMTVIAIGTSLPELVTSVVAAKKGETDLAVGNIVGSNIFNMGIVAGLPVAILGGIPNIAFTVVDVVVMIIAAFLLYFFAKNDNQISKWEGAIFLALFVGYYGYLIATTVGG
jgi:cation:H+ antiporter